ncbi:MAG: hypothetical protein EZS28_035577 [Streblomastix strix]|uniref:Uncharacterized protein n=1 Tax=Streblomastix strix TaxID=222440 RepID=A0A5J4UER7_9EUKA|nr:MAG: hypothetical protein EZS28_035577 [Streblomastix strix]
MSIRIKITICRDEDEDYEEDDEYAGEQHGGGEGEAPRGCEDEELEEDSDEEVYYARVCVYCNFRLWGCICTQSMFAMFVKLKLNGQLNEENQLQLICVDSDPPFRNAFPKAACTVRRSKMAILGLFYCQVTYDCYD